VLLRKDPDEAACVPTDVPSIKKPTDLCGSLAAKAFTISNLLFLKLFLLKLTSMKPPSRQIFLELLKKVKIPVSMPAVQQSLFFTV
jgi:hypothetical protein